MPNKTALITGASGGIGEQFARTLAADGHDLILVARSAGKLSDLALELHAAHGIRAETIPTDLSVPAAADTVVAAVDELGMTVDLVINNAGFGTHGDLLDADPIRIREEVALNVGTLTDLTTVFFQRMCAQGSGGIVNVGSIASFQPVPHMAVYAATKAYVLNLSEALWWEGKRHGVRVLALCPGATDTGFFDVSGMGENAGPMRSPQQVVDTALAALRDGKPSVVDGLLNAVASFGGRFLPRRLLIGVAERAVR